MTGLGTIINSVSIIAGGLLGHLTGKLFNREQQDAISKTCGVSVLFIAIAGAMEGMLKIEGTKISSGRSMQVLLLILIISLAIISIFIIVYAYNRSKKRKKKYK